MKKLLVLIPVMLVMSNVLASNWEIESVVIKKVASEYKLNAFETDFLLAIRKVENGCVGLEFGCGDGYPNHPARRFKNDHAKSLELQARWAAGTIKNRLNGDLTAFAKRYCPPNWKVWEANVKRIMLSI